MANVYSQAEQDSLNAAITGIGGLERAFWLGMYENGAVANGDMALDSDMGRVRFNGFRPDQPSNKLSHPNDKHTTGLNEDCVRQFGLEGWNDAICTRTWSGAKKNNIMMGHICEFRSNMHPMQHTNGFQVQFKLWASAFLQKSEVVQHWSEKKFDRLANTRIPRIMYRKCALEDSSFDGLPAIDVNGDAIVQLQDIIADMKSFFDAFTQSCPATFQTNIKAKLDKWEAKLDARFEKLNN